MAKKKVVEEVDICQSCNQNWNYPACIIDVSIDEMKYNEDGVKVIDCPLCVQVPVMNWINKGALLHGCIGDKIIFTIHRIRKISTKEWIVTTVLPIDLHVDDRDPFLSVKDAQNYAEEIKDGFYKSDKH